MKSSRESTPRLAPRWPAIVIAGSGIFAIGLGLSVLAGWHFHSVFLTQLKLGFAVMQYITAICFVLCGAGLCIYITKAPRWFMIPCGASAAAIGGAICLEYLAGWDSGLDRLMHHLPSFEGHEPLRPSLPTSLSFFLCGSAIAILGSSLRPGIRRLAVWILGSIVLSLCFMALCGYATGLSGTYAWGSFVGMALHTAVGMSFLSAGLLAVQFMTGRNILHDRWLPIPVAVAYTTMALILWQALVNERNNALRTESRLVAQDVANGAKLRLNSPVRALERIKRRWEMRGGIPYEEWAADGESYVRDEATLFALEWVNSSWLVQWTVPEDFPGIIGRDVRDDKRWDAAAALERSRETRETVFSPTIQLRVSGRGFFIYLPLYPSGRFDGFLVGIFPLGDLMDLVIDEPGFTKYTLGVYEGNDLIYGTPPSPRLNIGGESLIEFHGHRWRIVAAPTEATMKANESRLPGFILLLGLILAAALAVAVRTFQKTFWQARAVRAANRKLEEKISERKQAEKTLRETLREKETAQALLEAAGRIAHLGHWEISLDTQALWWSDITYQIHELPPGTPVSLDEAIAFYVPDDRQRIDTTVRGALQNGDTFDFEARIITAQDRQIWIHARGEPVRDESGKMISLRGVVQDINDRKVAAELLEKRNEELIVARRDAEAFARAKAEFLANMSHEIRTPLNAVIGMADLLADSDMPPHERDLIETIRTSGDVLVTLINDILDFSKIESGQFGLERIPVDLRACAESALDIVVSQASKKKLDLLYWMDPGVPPAILGDPTRLRQVIVNLLSNAIKFTEKGEVFLSLTYVPDIGGSPRLRVSVRDSGVGIPVERMDRLFHAFSQVDASTTRRYGGTGLGLAISNRLVEMMKGRIRVESQVGNGSTFQFEIPITVADRPGTFVNRGASVRSLAGLRLLIVDDNATNRWIIEMQARNWGMLPTVANGPGRALDLIQSGEEFDVAILDVLMPGMDGYKLAAEIRGHRTPAQLPILILTSIGDPGRDLEKLGISGVLSKPVKITPLFNALCHTIGDPGIPSLDGPRPPQARALGETHPLRILVAEDNTVNQRVIDLLLQRIGYHPEIVANGLEVLAAIERAPFQLILLDIQMPEMDGLETAREICRRYPPDNRPWMIALTALALEGDRDDCLAAGMNDYLSKPIQGEALQNALLRAIEGMQRSAQSSH